MASRSAGVPSRHCGGGSRLPISLVAGGVSCPGDSGTFTLAGDDPRGVASWGAGLLVRRGWCRGRPSVAPSARSREGDGRGLRPRRWRAGGLPRGVERCTGAVVRGGCPPRHCSGRGSYGKGPRDRCQGRHAPVDARGPRARDVGWGWPHLQSRAGESSRQCRRETPTWVSETWRGTPHLRRGD